MIYQDKLATLTPQTRRILQDKGTDAPGTGRYTEFAGTGTYLCRRCGLALFRSTHKFLSSCGWPSFDDELPNAIQRLPDVDGWRTEIVCQRCCAHLGHVFIGEHCTNKNVRHCVNSASLDFVDNTMVTETEEALFAGGCFWGVDDWFAKTPGVLLTESGYTGGTLDDPRYEQVCAGTTGHFEAVRVVYNPVVIDYEKLTALFLEIHDPTQVDGQGPDRGPQYQSAIFYYTQEQKKMAQHLLEQLEKKGFDIATVLLAASVFWPAEKYHQDYYIKTGKIPYCHVRSKRF